jgi:hypothetical protein
VANERELTVNSALDDNIYPGKKLETLSLKIILLGVKKTQQIILESGNAI